MFNALKESLILNNKCLFCQKTNSFIKARKNHNIINESAKIICTSCVEYKIYFRRNEDITSSYAIEIILDDFNLAIFNENPNDFNIYDKIRQTNIILPNFKIKNLSKEQLINKIKTLILLS